MVTTPFIFVGPKMVFFLRGPFCERERRRWQRGGERERERGEKEEKKKEEEEEEEKNEKNTVLFL